MADYTTVDIRNVALAGPSGSGKTTLVESMLVDAGIIGRAGKVEDGNTVCDYDDLEKEAKHSLDSALVQIDRGGTHINIIDTPGQIDFLGRAISCFPAVETVVLVISADEHIDTVTRRVMKITEERGIPRLIVINKIDHQGQIDSLLSGLKESFGTGCLPINLPTEGGTAVVDCFKAESGSSDIGDVSDHHTAIIDQVVEVDEDLMATYLEDGTVDPDKLHDAFESALRQQHLVPICFTDARNNVGITELLDIITNLCPNPTEGNPRRFKVGEGDDVTELVPEPDASKACLGHVFKVSSDPYVGKLCIFRVHQGTISANSQVHLDDHKKPIRVSHIHSIQGKQHTDVSKVIAGDIGAVAKIDEIDFDSVMHDGTSGSPIRFNSIPLPKPMFGLAIEGTSKGAETKMGEALTKLCAEDPTFKTERVMATKELVIRGLGELHLRMKLKMLKDRYGIEIDSKPPKVAYKETITSSAEGHHRHKKQSGGAGQFGEVFLRVEPVEITEDSPEFEFVDDTFGGSIPKQFMPAIEKGIKRVLSEGAIAGYPLQGVKVSVYDGKHHPVDSKEVAFITAGRRAFIDAVQKAKPALLEPFVLLEITIPNSYIGDISSDLSGKRARIQGTDVLPGDQALVRAEAPLSEVMSYANQLKSITGGAGSFAMEYSHDEQAPANVQAQVVAAFNPQEDED